MSKKENKSFVQMKETENNQDENIINTFKQYEYIEPKKKFPFKLIILIFFIIISIILLVFLLHLMDNRNSKVEQNNNTNESTKELNLMTTTTTSLDNNISEEITEHLSCSTTSLKDNLQIDAQIIANFHNQKLRSDINILTIKLLDETSREDFNNYVTVLETFSLYLNENDNYEITDYTSDNEFSISIKTNYKPDMVSEGNLAYDEDYDTVKQKLIELGHNCE